MSVCLSVCLSVGLNSAEVYDPRVNEWRYITSMSTRRSSVGVGVVAGLSPYVCIISLCLSLCICECISLCLLLCFSSVSLCLFISPSLSMCLCVYMYFLDHFSTVALVKSQNHMLLYLNNMLFSMDYSAAAPSPPAIAPALYAVAFVDPAVAAAITALMFRYTVCCGWL